MNNLKEYLVCPISFELFNDPVSVPCCSRAFNRKSLQEHFQINKNCPMCRADLSNFDIDNAPKNVDLSSMVDLFKSSEQNKSDKESHIWKSNISIINNNNVTLPVAELSLKITKSEFNVRPGLFIIVADRSGSMSGSPWNQVKDALQHIFTLSNRNTMIKTILICYTSDAEIIETTGVQELDKKIINDLRAGGGTDFYSAFMKIEEVLNTYICSDKKEDMYKENNISRANIIFLTDGQDGSFKSRNELTDTLKNILVSWDGPSSVYSVGFSGGCDSEFLESLWKTGSINGTYRYADPRDNGDSLCTKLQSVFKVASKGLSIPINLKLNSKYKFISNGDILNSTSNEIDTLLLVDKNNNGILKTWIIGDYSEDNNILIINSNQDNDTKLSLGIDNLKCTTSQNNILFEKWISYIIDNLAFELLDITNNSNDNVNKLHCSLILKRIDAIKRCTNVDSSINRLNIIYKQTESLINDEEIDKNKLGDLRFSSLYEDVSVNSHQKNNIINTYTNIVSHNKYIDKYRIENNVKYNRNMYHDTLRNKLQNTIYNHTINFLSTNIKDLIDNSSKSDIYNQDGDGNNIIHIASYCGHYEILKYILQVYTDLNLEIVNNDNETPLSLAIKSRGFYFTIQLLMDNGAILSTIRKKSLIRFAIDNKYVKTADLLRSLSDNSNIIDHSMTAEFIQFQYNKVTDNNTEFDTVSYFDVALSKGMKDICIDLIDKYNVKPTLKMLYDYCYPKKPDAIDTQLYLDLTDIVIQANPKLLQESNNNNENPLFIACVKGSKPHVQYYIKHKVDIEGENTLGNTPLWISCSKRYPCIIEELLNNGANVNSVNKKGNVPLSGICQRGPEKIAEILISKRAKLTYINKNGDSLILLCCRNGQPKILKLILNYVDPEFVNHKAHIDGFNALFASVEADKPECIKILYDYEIDLNQKTDHDNPILADASPLHLAAYYNRYKSAKTLIDLGANINITDNNGQSPLHIAVIQGNISIIKLLLSSKNINTDILDINGLSAKAYCKDMLQIRKLFIDPILDSLMDLAKGKFKGNEEKACKILNKYSYTIGCITPSDILNIKDKDNNTPLLQSIIHGTIKVIKTLLSLGSKNKCGVDCYIWAKWINNYRIIKLLPKLDKVSSKYVDKAINRLEKYSDISIRDNMILMIGNKPSILITNKYSGIKERMSNFTNSINYGDINIYCNNKANNLSISKLSNSASKLKMDKDLFESLLWDSKIFTVNKIISSDICLSPQQLLSINLYTRNELISNLINISIIHNDNNDIINSYIKTLYSAILNIPKYIGEVFIGSKILNRKLFLPGMEINWGSFISGSAIWKMACEDNFLDKSQTIILIKSKTGRLISSYCEFTMESEVIFLPNTKFIVTKWYKGDIIALGQKNVRDTSYKIDNQNISNYIDNKGLIIQLEEI